MRNKKRRDQVIRRVYNRIAWTIAATALAAGIMLYSTSQVPPPVNATELGTSWVHHPSDDNDETLIESGAAHALINKELCGFSNAEGELVIAPIYEAVEGFRHGAARVTKDGRQSFIDTLTNIHVSDS